jgi:hypothetical protein
MRVILRERTETDAMDEREWDKERDCELLG